MSINTDMKKCTLLGKKTVKNTLKQHINTYEPIGFIYIAIYKNKPRVNNKAEVGIHDVVRDEFTGITTNTCVKKGMRIKNSIGKVFEVEDIIKFRKFNIALKEVTLNV